MPQFQEARTYRLNLEDVAIGLTIFFIGLFKKTVIADGVAPYAVAAFLNRRRTGSAGRVGWRARLHASSSTSTSPATRTWRSACRACSASSCRSTSIRRTRR